MTAPSTFNLSEAFRQLGIRSAQAVPSIAPGFLVPTIRMGTIESFAPEAIESRGVTHMPGVNTGGAHWASFALQCLAPGGVVVEQIQMNNVAGNAVNVTIDRPFTVATYDGIFDVGGQPTASIPYFVEAQPNPPPNPALLNGTSWPVNGGALIDESMLERLFVPAGAWIWILWTGGSGNACSLRFREIPAPLGPP